MPDTLVNIEDLAVVYKTNDGNDVVAVDGIDLAVAPGEFVSVIGLSGSGKSTLLHCIGGLLAPSRGAVTLKGSAVRGPRPTEAAFVFQDYSLLPWQTVADNVAIGLRFAGRSKRDRRERAMRELEFVGVAEFADSYPAQLSGGMQQRVAVARALAMDPEVLLMDEPFGALDEQSRRQLGVDMAALLGRTGRTIVMVTHSLDEAIFWSDRVIVMSARPGRVRDVVTVDEPRPRDAGFMMSPGFNEIRATLWGLLEQEGSAITRPVQEAA